MSDLEEKVKAPKVRRKIRVSMPISLDEPAPAPKPAVVFPQGQVSVEDKKKDEPVKSGDTHYHIYNMVRGVAGGRGRRKRGKGKKPRQKK